MRLYYDMKPFGVHNLHMNAFSWSDFVSTGQLSRLSVPVPFSLCIGWSLLVSCLHERTETLGLFCSLLCIARGVAWLVVNSILSRIGLQPPGSHLAFPIFPSYLNGFVTMKFIEMLQVCVEVCSASSFPVKFCILWKLIVLHQLFYILGSVVVS